MQEFDVILRNACVNGAYLSDIGIKGGVITALGLGLVPTEDTDILDCEGAVVTPGGVDGHVHLSQDQSPRAREAGYVNADTGESHVLPPSVNQVQINRLSPYSDPSCS
jgi:dihydropyrimidinase